eukprot:TRINITY_DN9968_c0_g1_i1.p1 TRINITY_DN9968_c0_g1~~TRINITY_DN9968_c0_g1_i1.p1  ORF type:complete len:914 (+),score=236.63 TRINITY_DN9968_c0_g1_i1:159-2744(+)
MPPPPPEAVPVGPMGSESPADEAVAVPASSPRSAPEEEDAEALLKTGSGLGPSDHRAKVWEEPMLAGIGGALAELESVSRETVQWFVKNRTGRYEKLVRALLRLEADWMAMDSAFVKVAEVAPRYDACVEAPANGYRSLLRLVEMCALRILSALREIKSGRESILWRGGPLEVRVDEYVTALCALGELAKVAAGLSEAATGQLFLPASQRQARDQMLDRCNEIPTKIFYGKHSGFMYASKTRECVRLILLAMSQYSALGETGYGRDAAGYGPKETAMRCLLSDEFRGDRIVQQIQRCGIDFCKGFWNLVETAPMAQHAGKFAGPLLGTAREVVIPVGWPHVRSSFTDGVSGGLLQRILDAETEQQVDDVVSGAVAAIDGLSNAEQLLIKNTAKQRKALLVPSGDPEEVLKPLANVRCMWYCKEIHQGQHRGWFGPSESGPPSSSGQPPSVGLVVHFHGGGFVAQSPRSHEAYLREWARVLRCPILSVDYTLAPEAQWPYPVAEGHIAYRWALANSLALGSASSKVVLKIAASGDRVPDCVFLSYPALRVRMAVGPSRLLSCVDALLPLGILRQCLSAYAGCEEPSQDPLLSPTEADADLLRKVPAWRILASEFDPLLDDSVEFASRLRDAGHPDWSLRIAHGCPHGFLSLGNLEMKTPGMGGATPCHAAAQRLLGMIKEVMHASEPAPASTDRSIGSMMPPRRIWVRPEVVEGVSSQRTVRMLGERPLYVEAEIGGDVKRTIGSIEGRWEDTVLFDVGDGHITLRLSVRARRKVGTDKKLGVAQWTLPAVTAGPESHTGGTWTRVRLSLEAGDMSPKHGLTPVLVVSLKVDAVTVTDVDGAECAPEALPVPADEAAPMVAM